MSEFAEIDRMERIAHEQAERIADLESQLAVTEQAKAEALSIAETAGYEAKTARDERDGIKTRALATIKARDHENLTLLDALAIEQKEAAEAIRATAALVDARRGKASDRHAADIRYLRGQYDSIVEMKNRIMDENAALRAELTAAQAQIEDFHHQTDVMHENHAAEVAALRAENAAVQQLYDETWNRLAEAKQQVERLEGAAQEMLLAGGQLGIWCMATHGHVPNGWQRYIAALAGLKQALAVQGKPPTERCPTCGRTPLRLLPPREPHIPPSEDEAQGEER